MASTPIGTGASAVAETPLYHVRPVDPASETDSRTAARLHCQLFGDIGPIAKLGEHLLQQYCYSYVLRTGMMKAVLFEVGGQPAGLAAYTGDSVELHRAALRSHLPFVTWVTIRALLDQPSLISRLPAAAGLFWERRREKLPESTSRFAEMVAFGVLAPFRSRQFVRRTGLRVPDLLLDYVLDDVRTQGFALGRGVVLASNKPALAFFSARASRIEPYPAAVRPSIQVWFDLSTAAPEPAN